MSGEDIARFIATPPSTVEAFRRYTAWAGRECRAGRHVVLAVVPHGSKTPVGLFQVRRHGPTWDTAEWGFVFAVSSWGTGLFTRTAPLVIRHALETMGVRRLEARAVACNGRGNGALAKVGAVCEAVLCESFELHGRRVDERLWTIAARHWAPPNH
jgi:RimJ/RimL family protein N-acetyltransferase